VLLANTQLGSFPETKRPGPPSLLPFVGEAPGSDDLTHDLERSLNPRTVHVEVRHGT
jgi:hypothetical protein